MCFTSTENKPGQTSSLHFLQGEKRLVLLSASWELNMYGGARLQLVNKGQPLSFECHLLGSHQGGRVSRGAGLGGGGEAYGPE